MGTKFKVGQTVDVIGTQDKLNAIAATGVMGKHYTIVDINEYPFPLYKLEGSNWHAEGFLRSVGVRLGGE